MSRGKVISCLLVVSVVAMLAEQTEGFISFISPGDMRRMMEQEKGRAGKKSLEVEQRSEERESGELASPDWYRQKDTAKGAPLEIGVRLSPQQLDRLAPVLGEILHEMLAEGNKDH
ncbi:motilin-like [Amia ocellicauda]|uniref:motilin-like n=1 Tax=Amia ocellicauda TaxID=2972642 RepID=UPI003463D450